MPKENTHLYFAHSLLSGFTAGEAEMIYPHIREYLLGSAAPDIMFYSSTDAGKRVSDRLHGLEKEKPCSMVTEILKRKHSGRDAAFAAGYLTHCCLDICFHPVVYFFSGSYYSPDKKEAAEAAFLHRYLETELDISLRTRIRLFSSVSSDILKGLVFTEIISYMAGCTQSDIIKTFRKQQLLNLLFCSRHLPPFIHRLKAVNGLFYKNVRKGRKIFTSETLLSGNHPVTGEPFSTTYSGLFADAESMALNGIRAIAAFEKNIISLDELEKSLPDMDLDTGLKGHTAEEIKFTEPVNAGTHKS